MKRWDLIGEVLYTHIDIYTHTCGQKGKYIPKAVSYVSFYNEKSVS